MLEIKKESCCELIKQTTNIWTTNSNELVIESETQSNLYWYNSHNYNSNKSTVVMNEDEAIQLRDYLISIYGL